MILLADVNVSALVVATLRSRGHEVVRVGDVLDIRARDEEIVALALERNAVIVSRDQDFSAILATTGATRPSLVNLRISDVDPPRVAATIATVVNLMRADLARGAIVTIDDGGVRVHPLPIG